VNTVEAVVDVPLETGEPVHAFTRDRAPDGAGFVGNVLVTDSVVDVSDVPTEITAFTHSALNEGADTRMRTVVFNAALDGHPRVASDYIPQPRYLRADDARTVAAATRHAEREFARAMADFNPYECWVQGHAQELPGQPARLFAVNTLARVRDVVHARDEVMLATRVAMHGSRSAGAYTQLRLVPKGAIKVVPESP
jgi:prophage tail gpP-like protein